MTDHAMLDAMAAMYRHPTPILCGGRRQGRTATEAAEQAAERARLSDAIWPLPRVGNVPVWLCGDPVAFLTRHARRLRAAAMMVRDCDDLIRLKKAVDDLPKIS